MRLIGARAIGVARAALAALAALTLAACGAPTVTRAVNGELLEGRFISPRAYALYGIGADAEARGDLRKAVAAFEAARDVDPESPEISTRVGALRCQLGGDAEEAFERAIELDPTYEPAFRERARCARAHGKPEEALGFAAEAAALDPDQEEAQLLHAELLEQLGRAEEARRALRGWTVRRPRSVAGWLALAALAQRAGDTGEAERAGRRAAALTPRHAAQLAQELPGLSAMAQVDEALGRGDLGEARRLARAARLPPAELAVRAAALGRVAEARAQAALVVGADPASASARIALATAADLAGDEEALAEAWRGLPGSSEPLTGPSPLARLLLAELLARRVGAEAARAWLGAEAAADGDALTAAVAARVRKRLGS